MLLHQLIMTVTDQNVLGLFYIVEKSNDKSTHSLATEKDHERDIGHHFKW